MRTPRILGAEGGTTWRAALCAALAVASLSLGTLDDGPHLEAASPGVNGKIAFESQRDGNFEIYVYSPSAGTEINLTNNPARDRSPGFSPDGTKIAFYSDRNGFTQLFVMDAYGTNAAPVNPLSIAGHAFENGVPSWSPDGQWIAYQSTRDGNEELYRISADGLTDMRITSMAGEDSHPSWSPDGQWLAFQRTLGTDYDICKVRVDGTGLTCLTDSLASPTNDTDDAAVDWSPNGAKLLFQSLRTGNWDLFLMNADGSGQSQCTLDAALDGTASWSPDGAAITFASWRAGIGDIWRMSVSACGTEIPAPLPLVLDTAFDTFPDWQPLVDTDGDGCNDYKEIGPDHKFGGQRNPLDFWDFFDVTGDQTIDLSDTLDILSYFGDPGTSPSGNLRDRDNFESPQPWQTYESNTGVDLTDALVNLQSFGHDCSGLP